MHRTAPGFPVRRISSVTGRRAGRSSRTSLRVGECPARPSSTHCSACSAAGRLLPRRRRCCRGIAKRARRLVDTLVELTFLQRSDRPVADVDVHARDWRPWGPAASFFHFATRDVRFATDLAEVSRRMRAKARREPMPPAIKRYRGAPQITLPAGRASGAFPDVLRGRRTWRRFAAHPASLADLSDVLGLTFGVQRWVESLASVASR